jgi:putative ABC transport system substrate-binding protein
MCRASRFAATRRLVITPLGGAAWPLAARAQQAAMPVVGYLGFTSPSDEVERISSFRRGLKEAGFDEVQQDWIETDDSA